MIVLAISGSLRARSANGALLELAADVAPADVAIVRYAALATIPPFNPDIDGIEDRPPEPVAELRAAAAGADAVAISSPEYAHGVPGSLKNALDWLVSSGELVDKPVVLYNAAAVGGQFAQSALVEILTVMSARVIAEASILKPVATSRPGVDGRFRDEGLAEALRQSLTVLRGVHDERAAELAG